MTQLPGYTANRHLHTPESTICSEHQNGPKTALAAFDWVQPAKNHATPRLLSRCIPVTIRNGKKRQDHKDETSQARDDMRPDYDVSSMRQVGQRGQHAKAMSDGYETEIPYADGTSTRYRTWTNSLYPGTLEEVCAAMDSKPDVYLDETFWPEGDTPDGRQVKETRPDGHENPVWALPRRYLFSRDGI